MDVDGGQTGWRGRSPLTEKTDWCADAIPARQKGRMPRPRRDSQFFGDPFRVRGNSDNLCVTDPSPDAKYSGSTNTPSPGVADGPVPPVRSLSRRLVSRWPLAIGRSLV